LLAAADVIFEVDLAGRVLPFDSAAAREFAVIAAGSSQALRPMAQADAQIASIARSRGAALATRNGADFEACGVRVIDPWPDLSAGPPASTARSRPAGRQG
jgi:toxin FitB